MIPAGVSVALPNFAKAAGAQNDAAPQPIRHVSLGSSVFGGASLPDPATQAPPAWLTRIINETCNPLGNLNIVHTAGFKNGSIATDALLGDYAAAKALAGGRPTITSLGYGMNCACPYQYHSGQTLPGLRSALMRLIEWVWGDNSDAILFTTPHPQTALYNWTAPIAQISYPPGGVAVPALTYEASVVQVEWARRGRKVPLSYRHARANDEIRRVGDDMGVLVIDAEEEDRDARAEFGEAMLFNPGETVHPGLLGSMLSYGRASARRFGELATDDGAELTSGPKYRFERRKPNNAVRLSTAVENDDQLGVYLGAGQVWKINMTAFYITPLDADLVTGFDVPPGAQGTFSVQGVGVDATSWDSGSTTNRSTPIGGNLPVGSNGAAAEVEAIIRMGSTPGYVTPRFGMAAMPASGNATILADSHLTATRLPD